MNRLKELRLSLDLTQLQLSKKIHVAQNTISQYEKDRRGINIEILEKLTSFFNVSADYLFGWTDEPARIQPLFKKNEIELIKKYRQLDADGKKRISYALNLEYQMAAKPDEQNNSIKKKVM